MSDQADIIVVSGLPRSGTSLMMQMLEAGGIPILTDSLRVADVSNPRGYYEFEAVKNLPDDTRWIPEARGKAVKIISMLLYQLPPTERYRVLFMERNLEEVLSSQESMLRRLNRTPAPHDQMSESFRVHLSRLEEWLSVQNHISNLKVPYQGLIDQPEAQSAMISRFLGKPLNQQRMSQVVDPALYRSRGG